MSSSVRNREDQVGYHHRQGILFHTNDDSTITEVGRWTIGQPPMNPYMSAAQRARMAMLPRRVPVVHTHGMAEGAALQAMTMALPLPGFGGNAPRKLGRWASYQQMRAIPMGHWPHLSMLHTS